MTGPSAMGAARAFGGGRERGGGGAGQEAICPWKGPGPGGGRLRGAAHFCTEATCRCFGAAFSRVPGTGCGWAAAPSSGGGAAPAAAGHGAAPPVWEAPGGPSPGPGGWTGCAARASAAPRALLGSGPCLGPPKEQSIHNRIEVDSPGIRIGIGIGPRRIGGSMQSDGIFDQVGSRGNRIGVGSRSDRSQIGIEPWMLRGPGGFSSA